MTIADIEKRLAALETRVDALAAEPGKAKLRPVELLEKLHGTFEDDEAFREAMRLGRKWRQSQNKIGSGKRTKRR